MDITITMPQSIASTIASAVNDDINYRKELMQKSVEDIINIDMPKVTEIVTTINEMTKVVESLNMASIGM